VFAKVINPSLFSIFEFFSPKHTFFDQMAPKTSCFFEKSGNFSKNDLKKMAKAF
jgi:hypothetical protein